MKPARRLCFDLDGTLCSHRTDGRYDLAEPIPERVEMVNDLAEQGHTIIIQTARGTETGEDWLVRTVEQLERWGVKYDQLSVGQKPFAHIYIDDRGIQADVFFALYQESEVDPGWRKSLEGTGWN